MQLNEALCRRTGVRAPTEHRSVGEAEKGESVRTKVAPRKNEGRVILLMLRA